MDIIKNWPHQSLKDLVDNGLSFESLKSGYFSRNYRIGQLTKYEDLDTHMYPNNCPDHEAVVVSTRATISRELLGGLVINKVTNEYWWLDGEEVQDSPYFLSKWVRNCTRPADGVLGNWDVKETDTQMAPKEEPTRGFGAWYDDGGDGYRDR